MYLLSRLAAHRTAPSLLLLDLGTQRLREPLANWPEHRKSNLEDRGPQPLRPVRNLPQLAEPGDLGVLSLCLEHAGPCTLRTPVQRAQPRAVAQVEGGDRIERALALRCAA